MVILNSTSREHREQIIVNAARLAAAHIDGDEVDVWLADGRDDANFFTAAELECILHNTPYSSISTSIKFVRTAATLLLISTR
ncbi:MAG: hypothetical protein IKN04_03210 [Clostridia bacterium]|nr:hypothetical protein [Clostridia bacterium]